jgi:hypothetical protein
MNVWKEPGTFSIKLFGAGRWTAYWMNMSLFFMAFFYGFINLARTLG